MAVVSGEVSVAWDREWQGCGDITGDIRRASGIMADLESTDSGSGLDWDEDHNIEDVLMKMTRVTYNENYIRQNATLEEEKHNQQQQQQQQKHAI